MRLSCAGLTRASICYRHKLLKIDFNLMDRRVKPGNDEININAATRFPLCAESERLPPSRPRLFGAPEFRPGAPGEGKVSAAHRGYRRDAVPAGIRGRHLRRP